MKKKRVLLKFSGEALAGPENRFPIDYAVLKTMCQEVVEAIHESTRRGIQLGVGIVVGGGNIMRGQIVAQHGIDREAADYMGMLATLINGVAIQNILEKILGEESTRLLSAITVSEVAEPYISRRAKRHLERGRIVIYAAGTGNPFFTTDTAAAQRATAMKADVLLKATNVDGIYDRDPRKHADAKKLDRVTYARCVQDKLSVMDMTAFAHCDENRIPIRVFSINKPGNIKAALLGENIGTLVAHEADPA